MADRKIYVILLILISTIVCCHACSSVGLWCLKERKPKYWTNGQPIIHPLRTINVTTFFISSSKSCQDTKKPKCHKTKSQRSLKSVGYIMFGTLLFVQSSGLSNQTLPCTMGMILCFQYFNAKSKSRWQRQWWVLPFMKKEKNQCVL